MLARIHKSMDEKVEGLTLIELLVVMIIIGILAAIAIPVFLNQRKKAVDSSIKSDLRTVANELETFYTDSQAYPAAATVTQAAAGDDVVIAGGNSAKVSSGNDLQQYVLNGTGDAFCLRMSNTKGSTTTGYLYVSSQGGLQSSGVACPAAGAF